MWDCGGETTGWGFEVDSPTFPKDLRPIYVASDEDDGIVLPAMASVLSM